MSINDPQWGNSHRPEEKDPDQVPEQAGTAPVQPDEGRKGAEPQQKSPVAPPAGGPQKPAGPPEGPPDLEVLWQQLVHRIRTKIALLLRRDPPAPLSEPVANRVADAAPNDAPLGWQALSLQSWLIGVSLLLGAWLMSGFYLVDANQRGVLSRFGVITSTEDPGWHWRWPYPLESVRLVNVTSDRTLEVGVAEAKRQTPLMMLTADQNLVGVGYAVVYQVSDPVAYLSRTDVPAELLGVLAESGLRQAVSAQPLALVQGATAKQGSEPAPLLEGVRQQMQTSLDGLNTGIQIKAVQIKEVVLPSPVLQAAKQAEQDEQAQIKALREAQSAAGESLIKARKLANRLQEETTGYTQELDVAAMRLNASNPKPEVADALNQVETANAGLRQQYPLVFDSYAELVARTQPAGAQSKRSAPQAANSGSAPKASEWRDRELMRSRDRVDRPGSGS
ncbi:protease modulator HflK [Fluviibacter phosphoraccumulans]|uniref:protease modulator HflK n=1 Tax=Fluviibacter phosphoraccumulans TaxID=1751046 RepID=UPI0024E1FF7A|nr:protease modulator HflK [Fluviibacter phosphoraccumulans]